MLALRGIQIYCKSYTKKLEVMQNKCIWFYSNLKKMIHVSRKECENIGFYFQLEVPESRQTENMVCDELCNDVLAS